MGVKPGGAWWILGMGAISTYGDVAEYPSPEAVLNATAIPDSTFVTLSWNNPNSLIPAVQYSITMNGDTQYTTETTYVWDGLLPVTDYTFEIRSISDLGIASDPVVVGPVTTLLPDPPQLSFTGTKQVTVTNYDAQFLYEVWVEGGSERIGVVDSTAKYTVPSYGVNYEIRLKVDENAVDYRYARFAFKAERWTADTRREQCDRTGTCGGNVDCSCHGGGWGIGCDSGCCPHCGCCVSLYCGRCYTVGDAPQLIDEPGYTHRYSCWYKFLEEGR